MSTLQFPGEKDSYVFILISKSQRTAKNYATKLAMTYYGLILFEPSNFTSTPHCVPNCVACPM